MTQPEVLDAFARVVGARNVLTGDLASSYEVDWTGRYCGTSTAVIRPATTAEVAAVVTICREHSLPIVPQGGNTGMVGGGVPLHGEVVLSLQRMTSIDEVDPVAMQVSAQAGVTIESLQHAAEAAGLRYGIDFGGRGTATLGGTIATNAGGLNVLRHGMTRDQVVGIEVVLGTGDIVRSMSGLIKDNTGYHLPSLFVGSEGTLGIVTGARMRLVASPSHRVAALIALPSIDAAVHATATLRTHLEGLEAAELMLDDGVQLVSREFGVLSPFARAYPVYLLVEVAASNDPLDEVGSVVESLPEVLDVAVAADGHRRAALWRLRDDHTTAINRVGVPQKFDVTVPHIALAGFVTKVRSQITALHPEATTWIFGHVGDGNLHVNVTGAQGDRGLSDAIYGLVIDLGGSISAEHGIGTSKAKYLAMQKSSEELTVMRALKQVLDPDNILNPHVLFSREVQSGTA